MILTMFNHTQVNDEFGVGVRVEGKVLRITNAVVSDRGMYVCTAENAGGTAQAAAIVEVERKIFLNLVYERDVVFKFEKKILLFHNFCFIVPCFRL